MKARKKPVTIETEQWFPQKAHSFFLEAGLQPLDSDNEWTCSGCGEVASKHANCPTLEGWHIVCPGDYIIKGVNGEFYPCKPDIFAKTYDIVED